jgi:hypothetical protein
VLGRSVRLAVLIISLVGPLVVGFVGSFQERGYVDTGLTSNQIGALALAFFGLLIAYLLCQDVSMIVYVVVSGRWPAVSGRVVTSSVKEIVDDATGSPVTFYEPRVAYEYVVNERTYTSSEVAGVGFWYKSRDRAEAFLAEFAGPTGTTLRYNPRRPEKVRLAVQSARLLSEIKNGGYGYTLLPLGIGLSVIGLSAMGWLVYKLLKLPQ